ncbi:MAG TPA: ABC transporter permease [Gemmatimonadaceae bacterium]
MNFIDRLQALGEGVMIAFDAIRQNKVRAALTILGIAVGVFVVTAMSAAVHGINAGVEQSLAAAGPTTFFISKAPAGIQNCNGSADSCPWRHFPRLTVEEGVAISRQPGIRAVVAQTSTSAAFKYADRSVPGANVDVYTPGWTDVDGGTIDPGRSFTEHENSSAENVVIINDAMVGQLFPDSNAIGKTVSVNGMPFRVIGIYHQAANIFDSGDKPKAIIPYETARRRLNASVWWLFLTVKPRDGVPQDVAIDQTIATLRTKRMLKPAEDNSFYITTQEKALDIYNKITRAFFFVMITLSAIGLMVGGIGVVAIMMISVTERTREIGVRKALGATRGTILWQFLVEAATLTLVGAVIGLLVGSLLTWAIRAFSPIDASIPPLAIVLALATSAFTGILFGLLPAFRASNLDPVEALRYE